LSLTTLGVAKFTSSFHKREHLEILVKMDQIHDTFYSEKEIAIEPDLDLRKSTDKALPAPPKTPKRVMMKYRFSAVFPIAFAVASCVLSILVVVAGQGTDMFNGQYLVAVSIPLSVFQCPELTRIS
jgi:hypothetical protein